MREELLISEKEKEQFEDAAAWFRPHRKNEDSGSWSLIDSL
jgi:hypothetical protein